MAIGEQKEAFRLRLYRHALSFLMGGNTREVTRLPFSVGALNKNQRRLGFETSSFLFLLNVLEYV